MNIVEKIIKLIDSEEIERKHLYWFKGEQILNQQAYRSELIKRIRVLAPSPADTPEKECRDLAELSINKNISMFDYLLGADKIAKRAQVLFPKEEAKC
jgi:hypothetical protein